MGSLIHKHLHNCFSLKELWYFGIQQNFFCVLTISLHRISKRCDYIQGQNLIKLTITASSRTFLSEDGSLILLLFTVLCDAEEYVRW
jgi:hypothetical protein